MDFFPTALVNEEFPTQTLAFIYVFGSLPLKSIICLPASTSFL